MDDADDTDDGFPLIHRSGCATLFVADYWHELALQGKGGAVHGGSVWAVHLEPQSSVRKVDGPARRTTRVAATAYKVTSITEEDDSTNLVVVIDGSRDEGQVTPVVLGAIRPDHCRGMWALVMKDSEEEALDCQEVVDACGNWLRHGYWIEYGSPTGE